MSRIVMTDAKKLRPHPLNPRKSLGDLTELTESIKQNGIMQNLTAVPDPDKDDGYMIIIGHRRFAAGKKAGLKEFPVSVVCLDEPDQVKIMLCENIQRSDLTAIEQAEGFQMMIDFGISVDELSEQTGFAPSTIYHRLNIAKLDKDTLKKKMDQLTLTDLIELEKIEDVDARNEILKNANRQTFMQQVQVAVNQQEQQKREAEFLERLKDSELTEREANSWDRDVDSYAMVYCSEKKDYLDLDLKPFKYYTKSKYGAGFMVYSIKDETEEEKKDTELEQKLEDIHDEIGYAVEELDATTMDIMEEAAAFVKTVCKGNYIKEKRDEFLTECFMLDIIGINVFSPTGPDEFAPKAYGLETRWNYEGPRGEWSEIMETAVREEYGSDPVAYAAITHVSGMLRKNLTFSNWIDGIMTGRSDFYNTNAAEDLSRSIQALELIGFDLSPELRKYLSEDNDIVERVKKAQADYQDLIGRYE